MLSGFAKNQRQGILAAQREGWRQDEDLEVLILHLTALTAGTAIVATDPIYVEHVPLIRNLESAAASLRLFFDEE